MSTHVPLIKPKLLSCQPKARAFIPLIVPKAKPITTCIILLTLEETHYNSGTYGAHYGDSLWTNDVTGDKLARVSGQKTGRDDHIIINAIDRGASIHIFTG